MRLEVIKGDPDWDRAKARLADRSIPEPNSGCLLWEGSYHPFGYGRINIGGKIENTHRVAYAIHVGPVGEDDHVLHRCDVASCNNPDHLYLGGNKENAADRVQRGRNKPCIGERNVRAKLSDQQIMAILSDDRSHRVITAEYGVSKGPITNIKSGRSWVHLTNGTLDRRRDARPGNGGAKITREDAISIYSDGRPYKEIAASYGLCKMTISLIKRRKLWKEIHENL